MEQANSLFHVLEGILEYHWNQSWDSSTKELWAFVLWENIVASKL